MLSPLGPALFSLALAQLVLAQSPANVGNSTTTTTINRSTAIGNFSFTPEPRGRGTVGLIISCTITFWFCVWTAVHPNIITNATRHSRLVYRATLMLVSMLVPVGVIMCAIGQLKEARRINKAWREEPKIDAKDKGYLGMDGAFFVVMGGFVIGRKEGSRPPSDSCIPPHACLCGATRSCEAALLRVVNRLCGPPRLSSLWVESPDHDYTTTLTPTGFLKYLNEGRINPSSFVKAEIVDKGKANWMSKLISGFQAIWLIAVCISRLVAHLPLSLVLAPLPKVLVLSLTDFLLQLEIHLLIQVCCAIIIYFCWLNKPLNVNQPIKIKLQDKPDIPFLADSKQAIETPGNSLQSLDHDSVDKRCPPNSIAIIHNAFYDIIVYIGAGGPTTAGASTVGDTEGGISRRTSRLVRVLPMLLEGFITGAVGLLHVAAWNLHFPTMLEKWLWRISSIGMCLFPLAAVAIASCTMYHEDLIGVIREMHQQRYCIPGFLLKVFRETWRVAKKHGGKDHLMNLAHMGLIHCCLQLVLAYLLCVVYITAESYASMRDPAARTMITPLWSNHLPHAQ